jgi:hypothetical protein
MMLAIFTMGVEEPFINNICVVQSSEFLDHKHVCGKAGGRSPCGVHEAFRATANLLSRSWNFDLSPVSICFYKAAASPTQRSSVIFHAN